MPGFRENWEDCNHGPPGFLAMRSSESEAQFKRRVGKTQRQCPNCKRYVFERLWPDAAG